MRGYVDDRVCDEGRTIVARECERVLVVDRKWVFF